MVLVLFRQELYAFSPPFDLLPLLAYSLVLYFVALQFVVLA